MAEFVQHQPIVTIFVVLIFVSVRHVRRVLHPEVRRFNDAELL